LFALTRKKVGFAPSERRPSVADSDTIARSLLAKIGEATLTTWLPAGPTTARIAGLLSKLCATVEPCAAFNWSSPWTSLKVVWCSLLNCDSDSRSQSSCS